MVDGQHFTAYVAKVKELKKQGRVGEAEQLLLRLVDATEAEARAEGMGVAPWYYRQLAIIYRKARRHRDEVAVLERFAEQDHAAGVMPEKLEARLRKARELAEAATRAPRSS